MCFQHRKRCIFANLIKLCQIINKAEDVFNLQKSDFHCRWNMISSPDIPTISYNILSNLALGIFIEEQRDVKSRPRNSLPSTRCQSSWLMSASRFFLLIKYLNIGVLLFTKLKRISGNSKFLRLNCWFFRHIFLFFILISLFYQVFLAFHRFFLFTPSLSNT